MKILVDGHTYTVQNVIGHQSQIIQFINKEKKGDEWDGTTDEEILLVLIDRSKYLFQILPSEESIRVTFHLERALKELKLRTANRVKRKVEGTPKL